MDCTGATELRVHGVGGTPPDAILGDLAPEQVWGDRIGGFYRTRVAAGLGTLALTVNAVLVAVLITADILGYQAVRAGLAAHQWWLAPLNWPAITGHPARQLLIGW